MGVAGVARGLNGRVAAKRWTGSESAASPEAGESFSVEIDRQRHVHVLLNEKLDEPGEHPLEP